MQSRSSSRLFSLRSCLLCLLLAAACGGSGDDPEGLQCVANLPQSCTPDLDPSFSSLYTNVIVQRCGTSDSGNNCHGKNANPKSNLKLTDVDTAYQALVGTRVIPGDAHCSPLMERIESADPAQRMPLNDKKLSDGVRCAIQQWIEKGAPK